MTYTRLHRLLDQQHVPYATIPHQEAYTAQETAAAAHVPGRMFAKAVIVEVDGTLVMCVQAATGKASLGLLKARLGANDVHLASEREFEHRFPDCELGSMPPFGNLYGMSTYVAEALTQDEEIAFNAGTHAELVQLRYADFDRLVHPTVV